jgi:hypothetical protein
MNIRTGPCPHCVAGEMPLDGHTVEELKAELDARERAWWAQAKAERAATLAAMGVPAREQ